MADLIGWFGTAAIVYASYLIAHKRIVGYFWFGVANALFLWQGWLAWLPSLMAVSLFMIGMDVYGWYQWRNYAKN